MDSSQTHRLQALYQVARTLQGNHADIREILEETLPTIGRTIAVDHGCIVILHPNGKPKIIHALNPIPGKLDSAAWSRLVANGLVGFTYHSHRTVIIRDIRTDPRWSNNPNETIDYERGSAIGVPIVSGDNVLGVMVFVHPWLDFFDATSVNLLEEFADMFAEAIGRREELASARASVAHYASLFEDALMPTIITDLEGFILNANRKAREFLEYEWNELLGLLINTVHPIGIESFGLESFEALHMGEELSIRTKAITSTGAEVPVLLRARRLPIGSDGFIEWVEQDISAELELEQLRRDLTGMVYHDLRGPLQNIQTSLRLIERTLENSDAELPPNFNVVEVAAYSTHQLSRMVESLLDIQRLEAGSAILDRKMVSIEEVFENAEPLVKPLAQEAGQTLEFETPNALPKLNIDTDMVLRVVTNLVENAIKYTPAGGCIRVHASQEGAALRVGVTDNGPGIPPEVRQRIFEKFSRIKYEDAPKGVGLGLAFCRLAVEAHAGSIWVESEVGQGSTFYFTLPIQNAQNNGIATLEATS